MSLYGLDPWKFAEVDQQLAEEERRQEWPLLHGDGLRGGTMKVICAWCKGEIKTEDGTGPPDSHGICPSCKERYYPPQPRKQEARSGPPSKGERLT